CARRHCRHANQGIRTMRAIPAILAVMSLSLLTACGTTEPERAEGGAATGAATGATVGLIGGATGAAAGAATKPSDVDLGPPPWHDNSKAGQNAADHMAN